MYPSGRKAKVLDMEPSDGPMGKSRLMPKNRKKKPDNAVELDKTPGLRQIGRSGNSFKFWRRG